MKMIPETQAAHLATGVGNTRSGNKKVQRMDALQRPHDLHHLFDRFLDCVLVVNLCDEILYANPLGLRLLCRLPDHQGYLPPVLRALDGKHEMVSLHDLAGTEIFIEIKCQNLVWRDNHVKLLTVSDRTRDMQRQRELEQLVYRDELTGLYNRRGMDIEVRRLQARANALQQKLNLMFIDVNGLKQINDRLGHAAGDAALLETAEVIRQGFGEHAISARIGGDEFAVFLLDDPALPVHRCVLTIQDCLNRINKHEGRSYRLSLSIGQSQYSPGEVFDFKNLIRQADQNMYRAKTEVDPIPIISDCQQTSVLHLSAVQGARH